eukprot:3665732-Pyramimonas_sp.AAC.1
MSQTWNIEIIPRSLEANGLVLQVRDRANLPWNRPQWIKVRGDRQQRASALVVKDISSNHQQERKLGEWGI